MNQLYSGLKNLKKDYHKLFTKGDIDMCIHTHTHEKMPNVTSHRIERNTNKPHSDAPLDSH